MARIIGGIASTHVPAIGKAIAEKKHNDPYWKPFFEGFDYVHYWLAREKPDVAVIFYNDHGLNFFLDKLPTFAGRRGERVPQRGRRLGHPGRRARSPGDPDLSWHLINALVADEFDITMCQDMLIDHAVTIPHDPDVAGRALAGEDRADIDQHRAASAAFARRAVSGSDAASAARSRSYPQDLRVVVIGTGGLSHQLDGKRAGFINKDFDQLCLDKIVERSGSADALLDPRLGRAARARRASSSSTGWRCAAR